MLTLFRFEEEVYKGTGLDVEWVGHPLVDQMNRGANASEIRKRLGIPEDKTAVGLLPGSRESEVSRMLPVMLKTGEIIVQKRPNSLFLLSRSNTVNAKIFENHLKAFAHLPILRLDGRSEEMLLASDFSLICSGTATLEAALLKAPFLVIYKTAYLTYLFARNLMHIPYIGMANVLARKMIVPEFVQHNAEPEWIAEKALYYLNNPEAIRKMKKDLESVLPELGEGKAAERAARAITGFLQTANSLSFSPSPSI
jgi:lipid-A-disaccharide synthase